ncbi:MAG: 16S rRNA processing protein RimM [Acidobacteria bacterium]|nr:16S rRNA processing protein RimM [Acidobacteriota bacterium]
MPPEWVTVARLTRTRGNKGELAGIPFTDYPERFHRLRQVRLAFDDGRERFETVERYWDHQGTPIFKLAGVDSISAAELCAASDLQVPFSERITLPEGEYFLSDLVGCLLLDHDREIGAVTGWTETGGPVLLNVQAGGREVLVPFVPEICHNVDLDARRIHARLPAGLLEINLPEKSR